VLLSGVFFAGKVARLVSVTSEADPSEHKIVYVVWGQIFFASSEAFLREFDFTERHKLVVIDLTHAHFWDITAIAALDKVVLKFRRAGAQVTILGLNEASATMVDRYARHDKDAPAEA
jgi:SulP family sulfate permease